MAQLSKEDISRIKEEVPARVGNRIRELREEKGLTQTELAYLIQNDRQYMHKAEKGIIGLSVPKLVMIAQALEVEPSELLRFT